MTDMTSQLDSSSITAAAAPGGSEIMKSVSWMTFLGGLLMIVGTSIGGGMLALPVVTAQGGFVYSSMFLLACWGLMTVGAFLILEVNLWFPPGSNLISMARNTLGRTGEIVAWVAYLFLLYSLLAAYVAGGGEVFQHVFALLGFRVSHMVSVLMFVLVFALILIRGIKTVDVANRCIMFFKLGAFFLILVLTLLHVRLAQFSMGHFAVLLMTVTTMITSYGFAIIVPSLRSYFNSDIKKLRKALFFGSLIPLLFYLIWEFAIFGSVASSGPYGLHHLSAASQPVIALMQVLTHGAQHGIVSISATVFTSVCVFTAFLGVSLCLIDFLKDGFRINGGGFAMSGVYALTFVPPIICLYYIPALFTFGISFAGIFCMVLLTFLPALMIWRGRYVLSIRSNYRCWIEKKGLLLVMLISIGVMLLGLYQSF